MDVDIPVGRGPHARPVGRPRRDVGTAPAPTMEQMSTRCSGRPPTSSTRMDFGFVNSSRVAVEQLPARPAPAGGERLRSKWFSRAHPTDAARHRGAERSRVSRPVTSFPPRLDQLVVTSRPTRTNRSSHQLWAKVLRRRDHRTCLVAPALFHLDLASPLSTIRGPSSRRRRGRRRRFARRHAHSCLSRS